MKTPIDYGNIFPGDVWGTTRLDGLGAVIRFTEEYRFSKNPFRSFLSMFNLKMPSHILLVCREHDLYYGMEMTWPKIHQVDLHEYDGSFGKSRTVFRARIPEIASTYSVANQWILECHARNVKYDWKGLLEFWNMGDDDKEKWYCSEFFREMLRRFQIAYPSSWEEKVDPADVGRFCTAHHFMI